MLCYTAFKIKKSVQLKVSTLQQVQRVSQVYSSKNLIYLQVCHFDQTKHLLKSYSYMIDMFHNGLKYFLKSRSYLLPFTFFLRRYTIYKTIIEMSDYTKNGVKYFLQDRASLFSYTCIFILYSYYNYHLLFSQDNDDVDVSNKIY